MSFETIAQSAKQGLSKGRAYLDGKASALLSPKSAEGISGFIFDIPDSESVTLATDITDHFTEDNSFINDHKVKLPIIISLSGFIGEKVFRQPGGIEGALQNLSNRLEVVDSYLGDFTPGAVQTAQKVVQQVEKTVSAINQTLDKIENVVGFFAGEGANPTAQEKAFNEIRALWDSNATVTVQTPWQYFGSMSIESVTFSQDGTTKEITDISVTLKEFRVAAEAKIVNYDSDLFPPRNQIQDGLEEDQGIIRGKESRGSVLFEGFIGDRQ